MRTQFTTIILALTAIIVVYHVAFNSSSVAKGVYDDHLAPCSSSPNCFVLTDDGPNFPIYYTGEYPMEVIVDILEENPRIQIVDQTRNYVHAVTHSKWLHFKDDLEIYINEQTHMIYIRSASRVGYYDFSVNQDRVQRLKKEILQKLESRRHLT